MNRGVSAAIAVERGLKTAQKLCERPAKPPVQTLGIRQFEGQHSRLRRFEIPVRRKSAGYGQDSGEEDELG